MDKPCNSYGLQDKQGNLGLTYLQTLIQLVTHCYLLVLRIVVISHLDYDQGRSIYRMMNKGIELVASWLIVEYH